MLTNFFGKSKPINFILLSVYILVGSLYFYIDKTPLSEGFFQFQKQFLLSILLIFSMLVLNFIVKKNLLSANNTYTIFFFSCLVLLIPVVFTNTDLVLSNLFLLLAYRRILSLSSEKNREKKILDASIWISLAGIIYFWNLLFFIVLFIAIIQQRSKNFRLILIPFVGFFTILVLKTSYHILKDDNLNWLPSVDKSIGFQFQNYNIQSLIFVISLLVGMLLITVLYKLLRFSEIRIKEKSKATLLLFISLITVLTIVFYPTKTGAELIYIMAPLAIFSANLLERLETIWIKEMILGFVLLCPVIQTFL